MNRNALILCAALVCAVPAAAQEGGSDVEWRGLSDASTLGAGHNAALAEIGWPGLGLTVLHGYSERFDIGAYGFLNYGFEGVTSAGLTPGLKAGVAMRLRLLDLGRFSLGTRLSPGLELYAARGAQFGVTFPFAILAGVAITEGLGLHAGFEIPLSVFLLKNQGFLVAVEPTVGLEFRADKKLSLTFDVHAGPATGIAPFAFHTILAPVVRATFGVGYHFGN